MFLKKEEEGEGEKKKEKERGTSLPLKTDLILVTYKTPVL
jgi:hypothetical protein